MIYIINGFPGSGKTTFEEMVGDLTDEYICGLSTVTYVKRIAFECGWDGKKTPEARKFLSDLKKLMNEFNELPRLKTLENAKLYKWAFIDCREPEEIDWFKEQLGDKVKTVVIRRPDVEGAPQSNSSDANVLNYNYDIEIWNDGTRRDLAEKALKFVEDEGLKKRTDPFYIDLFGDID